jgi:hypothetical protein
VEVHAVPGQEEPETILALRPKASPDTEGRQFFIWYREGISAAPVVVDRSSEAPACGIGKRAVLHLAAWSDRRTQVLRMNLPLASKDHPG